MMQPENITKTPKAQGMPQELDDLIKQAKRHALLMAVRELLRHGAPPWCVTLIEDLAKEYEP